MTKTEQSGYIKDGKLTILNKRRMADDLRQFRNCDVDIIIKTRGKRSTMQNRYYFGVVVKEIQLRLRELGNDVDTDTVHEFLKGKFYTQTVVTPQGEAFEIPGTTTEMNKTEFMEYIERCKDWAADTLEIYIPEAGTQTQIFSE